MTGKSIVKGYSTRPAPGGYGPERRRERRKAIIAAIRARKKKLIARKNKTT